MPQALVPPPDLQTIGDVGEWYIHRLTEMIADDPPPEHPDAFAYALVVVAVSRYLTGHRQPDRQRFLDACTSIYDRMFLGAMDAEGTG